MKSSINSLVLGAWLALFLAGCGGDKSADASRAQDEFRPALSVAEAFATAVYTGKYTDARLLAVDEGKVHVDEARDVIREWGHNFNGSVESLEVGTATREGPRVLVTVSYHGVRPLRLKLIEDRGTWKVCSFQH